MYGFLKNIGKRLLPNRWLLDNEEAIRRAFAFGYRGRRHLCNICGARLSKFIRLRTGDLLCPFCGSLPRNRRLWLLLNEMGVSGKVLDFSPSRCLHRAMGKMDGLDYVSTDFAGEFKAQKSYDITAIAEPPGRFDLIICYHVLEHVEDDAKAISELYRVLKKGGRAIVQTPFKDGGIFEDPTIVSPAERLEKFGQEDHVRIYSAQGLKRRMEQKGFKVQVLRYENNNDKPILQLGLKEHEIILIALK